MSDLGDVFRGNEAHHPVLPNQRRSDAVRLSPTWLYRVEVAVAAVSALLFVWTLIDPQWIERWLDESPDGGDGSAERWVVAGGFFITAVLAAWLAHRQRRLAAN